MFTDFTLAEFADAAPAVAATGRMKKATTKRWDKNGECLVLNFTVVSCVSGSLKNAAMNLTGKLANSSRH